jgi:hypothetical protein
MLVNNVFSPKRMLRYALSYLACYTFGAQADCTTHLIVDTDIFSDVEYVLTATVPLATKSKKLPFNISAIVTSQPSFSPPPFPTSPSLPST